MNFTDKKDFARTIAFYQYVKPDTLLLSHYPYPEDHPVSKFLNNLYKARINSGRPATPIIALKTYYYPCKIGRTIFCDPLLYEDVKTAMSFPPGPGSAQEYCLKVISEFYGERPVSIIKEFIEQFIGHGQCEFDAPSVDKLQSPLIQIGSDVDANSTTARIYIGSRGFTVDEVIEKFERQIGTIYRFDSFDDVHADPKTGRINVDDYYRPYYNSWGSQNTPLTVSTPSRKGELTHRKGDLI